MNSYSRQPADSQAHCSFASPANALCTSDREIPNSRAIRAGVTPALNAARTAFSFPGGSETASASTSRLLRLSSARGGFFRRLRSASAAKTNLSRSGSSSCLIAASISLGKIYRWGSAISGPDLTAAEDCFTGSAEEASCPPTGPECNPFQIPRTYLQIQKHR